MKKEKTLKQVLSLETMNQTAIVNAVSQFILRQHNCFSTQNAMLGKDIYTEFQSLRKQDSSIPDVQSNSFGVKLSLISHSSATTSAIKSKGKKQGYYIDLAIANPASELKKSSVKLKEKDLYPILTNWLDTKIDKAIDVSKKRSGETWQNADILGASFINNVGRSDFELYAMEVKIFHTNWRVDLFQAVSHSRFANRSYFAFLLKSSDIDKLENDLKEYAYQFGIGLVAIIIKDDDWQDILIKKKDLKLSDGDDSTCDVLEISFAPHHEVNPIIQTNYLQQALSVHTIDDLRRIFK